MMCSSEYLLVSTGFLAAVVFKSVEQIEALALPVNVAISECLIGLGIVRDPVRLALPSDPNS